MRKSLPLFYSRISRHITNEILQRNNVTTVTQCNNFQNQVQSYFENSKDDSPELNEEPLLFHKRNIQLYRSELPKLHNSALKTKEGNIKEKLNDIFKMIEKVSNIKDPIIKEGYFGDLDIKCFAVINYLQPSEILRLLNSFFKIMSDEFKWSYFYHIAITNLINFAENKMLTDHEMIQLLWFISLRGLEHRNFMIELDPYVPDIDKLPLMEKCILVQSFYSTSRKLQLDQSNAIMKILDRDFKQLISNHEYLIILCKALVISDQCINVPLDSLTENILKMNEPINFLTGTYLLNLYALTHICEEKVVHKLVTQCFKRLIEDVTEKKYNIELHHIEKFLWSISFLGVYLALYEKVTLQRCFEQRYVEFTTVKENLPYLLNSIVSTIMLRSWSTKVIKRCLEDKIFDPFFEDPSRYKIQPQVQMLLTLLTSEVKMLNFIPEHFRILINNQFTVSENIVTVKKSAITLHKKNYLRDVEIECPIKAIPIPGVTFSTYTETFHIDVLDDVTCFKETTIPHGVANLKFRLLSRYGYRLIKIDKNIFKDEPEKIESYIEKYILDKIKSVTRD